MELIERYMYYTLVTEIERNIDKFTKEEILEAVRISLTNTVEDSFKCVCDKCEGKTKSTRKRKNGTKSRTEASVHRKPDDLSLL